MGHTFGGVAGKLLRDRDRADFVVCIRKTTISREKRGDGWTMTEPSLRDGVRVWYRLGKTLSHCGKEVL